MEEEIDAPRLDQHASRVLPCKGQFILSQVRISKLEKQTQIIKYGYPNYHSNIFEETSR